MSLLCETMLLELLLWPEANPSRRAISSDFYAVVAARKEEERVMLSDVSNA